MTTTDITRWINYWGAGTNGLPFHLVQTVADMATLRRFNSITRRGVMVGVSDQRMFDALQAARAA
jgi:hypothetical protein